MFPKTIYVYMTILYFVFLSNCFAVSDSNLPYKEGELLVKFAPKINGNQKTTSERNQLLSSLNAGEVKHVFKRISGLTLIKLPENIKVKDALPNLEGKSEIIYVEPNYKIKLLSTIPNDTRFNELWGMHNTGQNGGTVNADINAPEAWDIIHDACDIIVAVTDTGIDRTHPDLAANMWTNETELNGITGIDDDGNGYIDDICGWDFADNDNDPTDYMGHGTHVAGIIGAIGDNNEGVAGVCWNVKIMDLKVFPNYGEEGFISGAIDAIEYSVNKSAKVINASWGGGPYSQSLKDAIDDANENGVLFIVAAGNGDWYGYPIDNDYDPHYPSSYDCNNIIAVLATDRYDGKAYWSNYGLTSVDLGAPGVEILSCVPSGYYEYYDGTSMATPHVAGACALVWAARPNLTYLQVKEAVLQSVDKLDSLEGLCVSEGRLNLYNAINYWPPLDCVTLTKTDNVGESNCVEPSIEGFIDSDVNYTICWLTS